MNPELEKLQAYPFQRLSELLKHSQPNTELTSIMLSIGEPGHQPPQFVNEIFSANLHGLSNYPKTLGDRSLREAICEWLQNRFKLPQGSLSPDLHILPVNGTREALFSLAQAVVDRGREPLIMMPNPFYQIYEGAALLSGADPFFMACNENNGFLPQLEGISDETWKRCQMLYICTPGNPSGAVMEEGYLQTLIELAHTHDFVIASDECYSEIYRDESSPPAGLLGAAAHMGITDYSRCVVFHSLSKRSNVPGLRSGFVAGDASIIKNYLLYRTYHGCAMPPPAQAVSTALWRDEGHVQENRTLYREKFVAVDAILAPVMPLNIPAGGFYLWPKTHEDDQLFARHLYEQQHITVLPGSYLSRMANGMNPGHQRVRIALVAPLDQCITAAKRIRSFLETY